MRPLISSNRRLLLAGMSGKSGSAISTIYASFVTATAQKAILSNGNLTATHTDITGGDGARVADASAKSTGKYYFEIRWVSSHGIFDSCGAVGLGVTYANFAVNATSSVSVTRGGDVRINGGTSLCNLSGFTVTTDILGIAMDMNAHLVWARRNLGWWNANGSGDPVAGVAGLTIPAGSYMPGIAFAGTGAAINDAFTLNCGQSAFFGPAPTGFTAGWSI